MGPAFHFERIPMTKLQESIYTILRCIPLAIWTAFELDCDPATYDPSSDVQPLGGQFHLPKNVQPWLEILDYMRAAAYKLVMTGDEDAAGIIIAYLVQQWIVLPKMYNSPKEFQLQLKWIGYLMGLRGEELEKFPTGRAKELEDQVMQEMEKRILQAKKEGKDFDKNGQHNMFDMFMYQLMNEKRFHIETPIPVMEDQGMMIREELLRNPDCVFCIPHVRSMVILRQQGEKVMIIGPSPIDDGHPDPYLTAAIRKPIFRALEYDGKDVREDVGVLCLLMDKVIAHRKNDPVWTMLQDAGYNLDWYLELVQLVSGIKIKDLKEILTEAKKNLVEKQGKDWDDYRKCFEFYERQNHLPERDMIKYPIIMETAATVKNRKKKERKLAAAAAKKAKEGEGEAESEVRYPEPVVEDVD
ncbi:hypothetical protein JCM5353_003002 [Sporobolomyces roseus]